MFFENLLCVAYCILACACLLNALRVHLKVNL